MSEDIMSAPQTDESTTKKPLNTRYVNRRVERIFSSSDSDLRKKRIKMNRLAQKIVTEIATGKVKDAVSVSQAFAAGMTALESNANA